MAVLDIHEQIMTRSMKIARASEFLFSMWRFFSPFDVMRVLDRERIRFVLVGSFGLCGWRNQARAGGYAEVIVGRTVWMKAVKTLFAAYPKGRVCDFQDHVEIRQQATGRIALNIVKPLRQPYGEVVKNTTLVHAKWGSYRIPDLEMALTLTFAEMTCEDRCWADRYQAAHDFICIVQTNREIDYKKVRRLASLISAKATRDLNIRVGRIQRGEKIGDLTLGS